VIVDMPSGSAPVVAAAHDWDVKAILLTHSHGDHWADYDVVTSAISAPVMAHEAERGVLGNRIHKPVEDGREITVGQFTVRAIHTPGHTPGSTCFVVGRFLFSGDTLFPGGPGRTQTPANFQQTVESIRRADEAGGSVRRCDLGGVEASSPHRPEQGNKRADEHRSNCGPEYAHVSMAVNRFPTPDAREETKECIGILALSAAE
jgi:phosphoribosyl 1,2-cyclic phosphodiesterase